MTGTIIIVYAIYLGADDMLAATIAVMSSITSVVQIFSPLLFEKIRRRKSLVVSLFFIYRILIVSIVFVPFIFASSHNRVITVISLYAIGMTMMNFVSPASLSWQMSIVPENMRSMYFSRRDFYALVFNLVINLILGKIVDYFNKDYMGFAITICFVAVLVIIEFIFMSKTAEPKLPKSGVPLKLRNVFIVPLKDKVFRKVILFATIWSLAVNIAVPYFSIYMVKYLNLDYKYIMVLNLISSVAMVLTIRLWGRISLKLNWIQTAQISMSILVMCYGLWSFVNTKTLYLLPIIHILNGAAWSGINFAMLNVPVAYSPVKGRTMYIGLYSSLSGFLSFVAVLVGAEILDVFNTTVINIGGHVFEKISYLYIL
jgi:Na+/melibiose symporter-like transporter